ncbi:MAG: substrate-binding domain-containing protein [Solirubrobacterales bacterium]
MSHRALLILATVVLALVIAGCGGLDDEKGDQADSLKTPEEQSDESGQGEEEAVQVELPPRPAGAVDVEGQVDGSLTAEFNDRFVSQVSDTGLKVNPTVRATDEAVGFEDLCNGRIDLVDASRPVSAEEFQRCERNGLQLVEFQAGYDAAVLATKNETDVGADCVSIGELRDVFEAGSPIEAWNQIEPFFFPVRLDTAGPEEGNSDFDFVFERILRIPDPTQADLRDDYQAFEDERQVKNAVSKNPKGVLGIVGFSLYGQFEDKLRPLEIDGEQGDSCVFPSEETISSLLYPFSRALRLYTTTAGLQRAEVREFLRAYLEASEQLALDNDFIALTNGVLRIQTQRIENPTLLADPNLVDETGVITAARLPQPTDEQGTAGQVPGQDEVPTDGSGSGGGGRATTVPAPGTSGTIAEERAPDAAAEASP